MMISESREIEFKFAVSDSQAFDRLLQYLKFPGSLLDTGVTQTNHFFDSPARCLHTNHFVIRLREANGSNVLTIKGEQQSHASGSEVLSNRVEEEVTLPRQDAKDLLDGKVPPREAIRQYFGHRAAPLLEMLDKACAEHALVHIGQFNNERASFNATGFNGKAGYQIPDQRGQTDLACCKAQGKSDDDCN